MPKQNPEEVWQPDRVVKALQNLLMHPGLRTPFDNCPVLTEARAALAEAPVFKYPLKRWTVLLQTPEWVIEERLWEEKTFLTHVLASTAAKAIEIAKGEAVMIHELDKPGPGPEDWAALAIFPDYVFNINPQAYLL